MTWLVSYRSVSGEVVETHHDTREEARDALTDQLIASALQLWAIGRSYGPSGWNADVGRRRQEFFDRGDRFIHHVMRLMDSTEGEYVIVGKQGRQWLLCDLPLVPR